MTTAIDTHKRLARGIGIVVGTGLALLALVSWRVTGGSGALGADVRMEALQTGAFGVEPLQPFLHAPLLVAGKSVSGSVSIRNQTGVPLAVRLAARPSTPDLDAILIVRITAAKRSLFGGTLGALRWAGTDSFRLRSGQRVRLDVRASIPAGVRKGWQGRIDDVPLAIEASRVTR